MAAYSIAVNDPNQPLVCCQRALPFVETIIFFLFYLSNLLLY